jgi:two-component system, OmpR family, response regulator
MKVLLVDDEHDIRRIARLSLARVGGMDVIEAADGDTALRLAVSELPYVILLHVMMPGRDGPEILRALRAEPDSAGIPVVFLTARTQDDDVDRLRALGARGVLPKPFDPLTLAQQLRQILAT